MYYKNTKYILTPIFLRFDIPSLSRMQRLQKWAAFANVQSSFGTLCETDQFHTDHGSEQQTTEQASS